MAGLINYMEFHDVIVREPHSQVTLDLLDNSHASEWTKNHLSDVLNMSRASSLFFPDKSAVKRYDMEAPLRKAWGHKERDFRTASIEVYEVQGEYSENVLMVDDLCSRGGTFVHAAKILRKQGVKYISLLVTHCEDNVFTGEIFDWIDHIYTSQGMLTKSHPRITELT